MAYPTQVNYEILYARFLSKSPECLLRHAGDLTGKFVLDLAGGSGRASLHALQNGATEAHLVDSSKGMIGKFVRTDISVFNTTIEAFLFSTPRKYDIVICQQAINYWLTTATARHVAEALKPGGIFLFNTFKSPIKRPVHREYVYQDRSYIETTWQHGKTIHHHQICKGHEPHYTEFMSISPEEFKNLLSPHFVTTVITDDRTLIYKCERMQSEEDIQNIQRSQRCMVKTGQF